MTNISWIKEHKITVVRIDTTSISCLKTSFHTVVHLSEISVLFRAEYFSVHLHSAAVCTEIRHVHVHPVLKVSLLPFPATAAVWNHYSKSIHL